MAGIAIGLALLTRIGYSGNYLTEVLPAVMIFGLSLAINVAQLTSTVLAAITIRNPRPQSGPVPRQLLHPIENHSS